MVDHSIREAGEKDVVASRRMQFVEINESGAAFNAGWAPHLDLLPIGEHDLSLVSDICDADWLTRELEERAIRHASKKLVPEHYAEVKQRRERQADKTLTAVNDRLVKEINYWSDRYIKLKQDIEAGKKPKLQPEAARRRVDELTARLKQRKQELTALKDVV